jgi:hypothetical protein
MHAPAAHIHADKQKVLAFTDNRQDAALQAGNFNDTLFVMLLRAAILAAVRNTGPEGLAHEDFGRRVQSALGFTALNRERRKEWLADPATIGVSLTNAERILGRVIAYRVWADQRRGWRFTNPNLEDLGLIRAATTNQRDRLLQANLANIRDDHLPACAVAGSRIRDVNLCDRYAFDLLLIHAASSTFSRLASSIKKLRF